MKSFPFNRQECTTSKPLRLRNIWHLSSSLMILVTKLLQNISSTVTTPFSLRSWTLNSSRIPNLILQLAQMFSVSMLFMLILLHPVYLPRLIRLAGGSMKCSSLRKRYSTMPVRLKLSFTIPRLRYSNVLHRSQVKYGFESLCARCLHDLWD